MSRAYQGHGTRRTPQSEPIPGSGQKPNSAGGYTWTVDPWTRLDRFLVLGSEGGTFYIGERELTAESVNSLRECLSLDGARTVRRITEVSRSGRAPRNTPAVFALAVACAHTDNTVKRLALDAIPDVCRTGTHLFTFATLVSDFRGWGRSLRRGIGQWYTQDPASLAFQAIKYRQREGWTHKDMLRLAHPARTVSAGNPTLESVSPLHERLYNWIVRREMSPMDDDEFVTLSGGGDAERIINSFELAMDAKTPSDTAALVREYGSALPREALRPEHLNEEVWTALVESGMPMTALVRNLANLTRKGVIKPLDSRTTLVCDQLTDGERLRRARVHPYAILLAAVTYASGGMYGRSNGEGYTPVSAVNDALDASFYAAFGNVTPTNKRILLALDVSGSMGQPILGEYDSRRGEMVTVPLSVRDGAAAMAMVTKSVESNCATVAFSSKGWVYRQRSAVHSWYGTMSDGIEEFDLSSRRSLRDVITATQSLTMGGTDCALPMLYATARNLEVDAFVMFTDSETWAGDPHPSQALRAYREASGIPAKCIVVGMASNGFSVADPNDAGSLDVVGFDVATPNVISDFIS